MPDIGYYKKYEPIFGSWHINRLIGEGNFGSVYEIERKEFGTTMKAALKAITIPQNRSELESVMSEGMDEVSAATYYEDVVKDLVNEVLIMTKLKGNSNIVSYEDHTVVPHDGTIGWDILIRMEVLTPLIEHINTRQLTRKDVIKLGIDLCKALELCQKHNIIHRDIKPENIFVAENGDYKLGDFGIARTLEHTMTMLSKKGTQSYMAPEVFKDATYGSNVDIYSLGIVMYRLLNDNRTPFLPAYPAPITHSDRETSLIKRISGVPIPKPVNADGRLAEIVLKACSYLPENRYESPIQMREELEAIMYSRAEAPLIYPKGDDTPIKSIEYVGDAAPVSGKTELLFPDKSGGTELITEHLETRSDTPESEKLQNSSPPGIVTTAPTKRSYTKMIAATIATILFVVVLVVVNMNKNVKASDIIGLLEKVELEVGDEYTLQPIVQPSNSTELELSFLSSDEKCVSVDENGVMKAINFGEALVTVSVGSIEKEVAIVVSLIEWRNMGYESEDPYREYELKYLNNAETDERRFTGKVSPPPTPEPTPDPTPEPIQNYVPVSTPQPPAYQAPSYQAPSYQAPVQTQAPIVPVQNPEPLPPAPIQTVAPPPPAPPVVDTPPEFYVDFD